MAIHLAHFSLFANCGCGGTGSTKWVKWVSPMFICFRQVDFPAAFSSITLLSFALSLSIDFDYNFNDGLGTLDAPTAVTFAGFMYPSGNKIVFKIPNEVGAF